MRLMTVFQFVYLISVAVIEGHIHKPWNDKDLWFDHDDVDYWASDDDFTLYETDDIFPVSNENNDDQFRTTDNPPDSLSKDIDKFQHDIENLSTADDKLRTQDVSMGSWQPEAGMGMRHLHRKYKNKHRGCRKHKNKPMAMIKFDQLLKASKESSPQKFEAQVSPESEEIPLLDTESQLDFDSDNDSEMDREGNAVMESDGELDEVRNVSANPEAGLLTDAEPRPEPETTLGPLSESSDEAQAVSKPSITATSHMETAYQTGSETEAQYTEEPSALTAPGSVEETLSEFTEDPADFHGQGYSNQSFVQEITNAGHLSEMLGSKLNPKVLAATKELDRPSTRERVIQPPWFSLKESEDNRFKVESITKPVPRAKGTAFVTERETTSVYFRGKSGAADSRPMVQGSAPEENRNSLCKVLIGCLVGTFIVLGVALGLFLCRRYRKKKADGTDSKLSSDVKEPGVHVSVSSGSLTKQKLASEMIGWEQTAPEKTYCEQDYPETISEKADDIHVPPSYESAVRPPNYLEVVWCDDGDTFEQNLEKDRKI